MTWRVFVTAASDPDFVGLSSAEWGAINDDLFSWVVSGPPRGNRRMVAECVSAGTEPTARDQLPRDPAGRPAAAPWQACARTHRDSAVEHDRSVGQAGASAMSPTAAAASLIRWS